MERTIDDANIAKNKPSNPKKIIIFDQSLTKIKDEREIQKITFSHKDKQSKSTEQQSSKDIFDPSKVEFKPLIGKIIIDGQFLTKIQDDREKINSKKKITIPQKDKQSKSNQQQSPEKSFDPPEIEFKTPLKKKSNITQRKSIKFTPTNNDSTYIKCEFCSFKTKPNNMRRHVIKTHPEDATYTCEYCVQKIISITTLEQHIQSFHACHLCQGENPVWYQRIQYFYQHCKKEHPKIPLYTCQICENDPETPKTYNFYTLKKFNIHKIGFHEGGFPCKDLNCSERFKSPEAVCLHYNKEHKGIKYPCKFQGCKHVAKEKGHLKTHYLHSHSDEKPFKCNVEKCNESFKSKSNLKNHVNAKHIRNYEYVCEECGQKFKNCSVLCVHRLTHLSYEERSNVCNINDCNQRFSRNADLKRHQDTLKHSDYGDLICDYCMQNSVLHKIITDRQGPHNVCKKCYDEANQITKPEKVFSKYLDDIEEIRPYLIASDDSFRSINGCQLYRPDKLYASNDLVLHIECDEYQHLKNDNYTPECELARISNCYDEFPGKKYVVIRWNPHSYTIKGKICKKSIEERRQRLKELILHILADPPEEQIYIYYMYYSDNNKLLPPAETIKYELVY